MIHDHAQPQCPERAEADTFTSSMDEMTCAVCLRTIVMAALQMAYGNQQQVEVPKHVPSIVKTQTPEPLCMESWVVGCSCGWNDPHFWAGEEGAVGVWAEHLLTLGETPEGYRVLIEVLHDDA